MVCKTQLFVGSSKEGMSRHLAHAILVLARDALARRNSFSIALSGGSLPSLLTHLVAGAGHDEKKQPAVDPPQFDKWHVILADERCVPMDHDDSNMKSLAEEFLSKTSIPRDQIHGIDEEKLKLSTDAVAKEYEVKVRGAVDQTGGALDLAVLGFGPDGHTCSLFPGHSLAVAAASEEENESSPWVSGLDDSPKPPPSRITLTVNFLNRFTRNVIFCGAGSSKAPILQIIFDRVMSNNNNNNSNTTDDDDESNKEKCQCYDVEYKSPPPYPCAMIVPERDDASTAVAAAVTWIVDQAAMEGVTTTTTTTTISSK